MLPTYLRDSHYAQKYGDAIRLGHNVQEPLPSRLMDDKAVPHVVSIAHDKMEVRFIGPVKNNDLDAASVRANHPIPSSTGLFYFEVTIISKGRDGFIGVGFCRQHVILTRLPGWEDDSWGYHGDDGHSFCCHGTGQEYGPKFSTGDVVGCAINFVSGECFYTKNGVYLGVAFTGLSGELYPSVGLRTIGEQVRVNFGAQPFVFDIDFYYQQEKLRLYKSVKDEEEDVSNRIQDLVSGYLSHNGYIDSAQAMAVDHSMQTNQTVRQAPIDTEATNRQHIRAAVTRGDMDAALVMLKDMFPEVMEQNEILIFQIRCRKFIEMMSLSCRDTDLQGSNTQLDEHSADRERPSAMQVDMIMDDQPKSETSQIPHSAEQKDIQILLQEAVQYGRELRALYSSAYKSNPVIRTGLIETFSLLAYPKPAASPVAHLLSPSLRTALAEDVNRAILITSGKSARSELEEIVASVSDKINQVKGAEFVNVQQDFFRNV